MSDYWIKYKKCPICESEIKRNSSNLTAFNDFDSIECINGCFGEITLSAIHRNGYVFEKKFQCDMRRLNTVQDYLNAMYSEIAYWKKDDRYLTKILAR